MDTIHAFIFENFFKDGQYIKQTSRAKRFDQFFAPYQERYGTVNRAEILWRLLNGDPEPCRECGAPTAFKNFNHGFSQLCSDACARKNGLTKARRVHAIKGTLLAEHGVDNVMKIDSTKLKASDTILKRYKVKWYVQTPSFAEARKVTSLERYGTEYPAQSTAIKEQVQQTILERYGRKTARSFEDARRNRIASVRARCEELNISCPTMLSSDVLRDTTYSFTHACGHSWQQKVDTVLPACEVCHRGSKVEQLVKEWSKMLGVPVSFNVRSIIPPLELDMYFPEHKLAIEVNGLYWHCDETGRPSVKEKTELCLEQGVQLITVWEHEWHDVSFRTKLQALIKTKLGLSERIYARATKVVDVPLAQARQFLNKHHLQGWASSSRTVGLVDKSEELVMLLSVGRRRYGSGDELEIIRLCTRSGLVVVGGFSKLLKVFAGQTLLSYCDRRFGTGAGYAAVGFQLDGTTKPNYLWWRHKTFLKRGSTTKSRLPELLGVGYDPALSEHDNMIVNGYRRISDAGNLRFKINA